MTTVLDFIRGIVRPAALVGLLTINLGMLVAGIFVSEAREYIFQAVAIIEGPTLLVLGFWFSERSKPKILVTNTGDPSA